MPRGVYERTPEMKTGKHKRTPEMNAANSKSKRNSDAIKAAGKALRGVSLSPEHCAKIKKALTGRTLSPEHCASLSEAGLGENNPFYGKHHTEETCLKISETRRNSDTAKSSYEAMRGGDDIVGHHYIYDHSDLSKYIMKMTRSRHTLLHNNMRKSGTIVPHINVGA